MEIYLNNKYTIDDKSDFFETIPFIIGDLNYKNNLEKKKYHDVFEISYFPTLEFVLAKAKMEDEKCMICLEEFTIKDFYA